MTTFDSRKDLSDSEMMMALGAGVGAGLAVGLVTAYLARIYLQKEPLSRRPRFTEVEVSPPRIPRADLRRLSAE